MDDWRAQQATNQTVFREMNEWSQEYADSGDPAPEMRKYLCECSDASCSDPIALTRNEYEAVRSVPIRFAIALDHENPEIDLLVSEYVRYAVVDKAYGAAARIALATDPRSGVTAT